MIGIRFEIPNDYGKYLKDIFEGLNTSNYYWQIDDTEIMTFNQNYLFDKNIYNDKEFSSKIKENNYYIIFADIKCIKTKKKVIINNYDSFLKSDCEILLLVVDSSYVDLYVKSKLYMDLIKSNVERNDYKNVEYIYNDDNPRNIFTI